MREDPIFSGGVVKAALVLLVAGALGVGAYALADGGLDVDLPDLPEVDLDSLTTTDPTTIEETTLEDTTVGAEPVDPYTSAGFGQAISEVQGEVGSGAELTRLFINGVQTQFIVQRGDGVEAYSVRADSGELVREDATITISGNAKISDFAFPLDGLDPAAIDRMLSAARKDSGAGDFEPTVLSLERAIPSGSRELQWTINAQGSGRNLLYRANADGTNVRNEGGEGSAIPPAALEAQKLNECIQAADNDPEKVFACLEQFQ